MVLTDLYGTKPVVLILATGSGWWLGHSRPGWIAWRPMVCYPSSWWSLVQQGWLLSWAGQGSAGRRCYCWGAPSWVRRVVWAALGSWCCCHFCCPNPTFCIVRGINFQNPLFLFFISFFDISSAWGIQVPKYVKCLGGLAWLDREMITQRLIYSLISKSLTKTLWVSILYTIFNKHTVARPMTYQLGSPTKNGQI